MFDETTTAGLELEEYAASATAGLSSNEEDGLGIEAFDDVLSDPAVAKVAPAALVERAQIASSPRPAMKAPAPMRASAPMMSPPPMRVEAPAPREQTYVPAMGPRPGKRSLGLDAKEESNLAGLSLLVVGISAAVGAGLWGLRGGAAGTLAGGAALNAYRATRASSSGDNSEALLSLTYAVLGAGAAGYLVWSQKAGKEGA